MSQMSMMDLGVQLSEMDDWTKRDLGPFTTWTLRETWSGLTALLMVNRELATAWGFASVTLFDGPELIKGWEPELEDGRHYGHGQLAQKARELWEHLKETGQAQRAAKRHRSKAT